MTTTLQSTHDLLDEALAICAGQTDAQPTTDHLKALFEHHASLTGEIAELHDQVRELRDALGERHDVRADIADVVHAGDALAAQVCAEMRLEERRPIVKAEAVRRIMQTENEDTHKPHSASSAEKIVETDAAYAAHRTEQIEAVRRTIQARARYEAAKLRARLAVEHAEVSQ